MTLGQALPAKICVWDTETDGVDLEDTRIITAFVGVMDTASFEIVERYSWVLQPEREIPRGAAEVHGYSTDRARMEGMNREQGIGEIASKLDELGWLMPIVAMNAMYDFTILDRELVRVGIHTPLVTRKFGTMGDVTFPTIFDPMVFDRAIDKYRKGSRKLVDLCRVYGVPVEDNAHDAEADCRMAGGVAIKLMGHSRLQDLTIEQVHSKLIATHRANSLSLASYWESTLPRLSGKEREEKIAAIADVRAKAGLWPCVPRPTESKEQK